MPRLPKPKPLRQNTERRDLGLVGIVPSTLRVPDPPADWLAESKAEWQGFWTSPLSSALLPVTDEPAVRRLFGLRDERERMMRGIRKARLVPGARGQPRANPLYAQLASFDSEIRQLEDRIGLTPQARLKLGISLGEAQRSLAQIAEAVNGDDSAAAADVLLAFAGPSAIVEGPGGGAVDGAQPRQKRSQAGERTERNLARSDLGSPTAGPPSR